MGAFNYNELIAKAQADGGATSYDPIPNGEYNVVVEKAEAKESKKGDPQIVITYKITDDSHKNRKLWQYMTFIPSNAVGLAINFRQLDVLGATSILEQGGSLVQVAGFLLGKGAVIKTEQRVDGTKTFNDVKDIKANKQGAVGPVNGFGIGGNTGVTGYIPPQQTPARPF